MNSDLAGQTIPQLSEDYRKDDDIAIVGGGAEQTLRIQLGL